MFKKKKKMYPSIALKNEKFKETSELAEHYINSRLTGGLIYNCKSRK